MIRTGGQYRESLRKSRDIRLDGERVADLAAHPVFKPLVDTRARLYDLQHAPATRDVLSFDDGTERHAIANKLPLTKQDWWDKRRAMETLDEAAGGWTGGLGSEAVAEMWSLFDGQDVLNEIDPAYRANLRAHIHHVLHEDPFLVCARSDQAGPPLRAVRDTDAGIVVQGVAQGLAAAYADLALVRPCAAPWGDGAQSEHALGFVCDLSQPGIRFLCRTPARARPGAQPSLLARHLDGVPTQIVFDDTLIPWERVLFYRHTEAARFVRATQDRYAGFARLQRSLTLADLLAGLGRQAARFAAHASRAQDALARLAGYREGIHTHLAAAITLGERSPGGLLMPNQSLVQAGQAWAGGGLREMAALVRTLCEPLQGAGRAAPEGAGGRDRLLAHARDLLDCEHVAPPADA